MNIKEGKIARGREERVKTALATEWPIILRGAAAAGDVPHQRDRVSYQSNITASSTGDAGVRRAGGGGKGNSGFDDGCARPVGRSVPQGGGRRPRFTSEIIRDEIRERES